MIFLLLTFLATGHKKAVTGIVCDNLNRYLITSSVDRTIKVRKPLSSGNIVILPLRKILIGPVYLIDLGL